MKIIDTECNSFLSNTSLLRGEQVFTSLLFYDGQFLYLEEHLERLIQGAKFFFPLRSWEKTKEEIRDYLYQKIETTDPQNYYCRLTIIDDSFFLIFKVHELSANSLSLTSGFQIKTPNLRPSYLKLGQYADSVLELKNAKNKKFDDVVFYDNSGFITETSTSNIFLVNPAGEIKTPYSSSMVLAGVLRSQIMKSLKVREANLTRFRFRKCTRNLDIKFYQRNSFY